MFAIESRDNWYEKTFVINNRAAVRLMVQNDENFILFSLNDEDDDIDLNQISQILSDNEITILNQKANNNQLNTMDEETVSKKKKKSKLNTSTSDTRTARHRHKEGTEILLISFILHKLI